MHQGNHRKQQLINITEISLGENVLDVVAYLWMTMSVLNMCHQ